MTCDEDPVAVILHFVALNAIKNTCMDIAAAMQAAA
jgi:hypothetical protein